MPLVTARITLVATAVLLAATGILAPLAVTGRAAVLLAGACCGALDVVLVRSTASAARVDGDGPEVVPVLPPSGPDVTVWPVGEGALDPPTGPRPSVLLGRAPGGRTLSVPLTPGQPLHVVVVGVGPLAEAVHEAVGAQVAPPGDDVRSAVAPAPVADPTDTLPTGTAVRVRFDADGRPAATVVLVPDLRTLPRSWHAAVEVSRYGCVLHRGGGLAGSGEPLDPVLPALLPTHTGHEAPDGDRIRPGVRT